MNTFKITSILYITALFALTNCGSDNAEVSADKSEKSAIAQNTVRLNSDQLSYISLQTATPDSAVISTSLKVNGTIALPPKGRHSVSVPYGGFVKQLDVLPGSTIRKGEPLFRIENPDFITMQQNYLKAKSRNEFLEAEYERQGNLHKDNVTSTVRYQEAKSDFLQNQAELKALKTQLQLIGIDVNAMEEGNLTSSVPVYSDVNGKVKSVMVDNGTYVSRQDVILKMYDLSEMHAELKVYENDLQNMSVGDVVQVEHPLDPSKTLAANVFLMGAGIDEDRTITVHAEFENVNPDLIPGTFISALIEVAPAQTLVLPEDALIRYSGNMYVFVQTNSSGSEQVYEMKPVKTGREEKNLVEIIDTPWISRNLTIVVEGGYDLLGMLKE